MLKPKPGIATSDGERWAPIIPNHWGNSSRNFRQGKAVWNNLPDNLTIQIYIWFKRNGAIFIQLEPQWPLCCFGKHGEPPNFYWSTHEQCSKPLLVHDWKEFYYPINLYLYLYLYLYIYIYMYNHPFNIPYEMAQGGLRDWNEHSPFLEKWIFVRWRLFKKNVLIKWQSFFSAGSLYKGFFFVFWLMLYNPFSLLITPPPK